MIIVSPNPDDDAQNVQHITSALTDKAKVELGRILENVPNLVDVFARDTAFASAESLLKNLKALIDALNDPRFSTTLGGTHG